MKRRVVVLLAATSLGIAASGCVSTGAVPRPFPGAPSAARPSVPLVDTYALVGTALDLRGTPYRNGGSDPQGFDCSGFTQFVFAQYGVRLPREVREQFQVGSEVRPVQVQAGDLLFFATDSPSVSHVAIAVGGDEFVHAPSSTGVVRVERLGTRYWSRRFVGARRVL